jgi:aspartyl-tRNA synthetase
MAHRKVYSGKEKEMSVSAMKQALEALEGNCTNPVADPEQAKKEDEAITALRQAIEEAEKQEPDDDIYDVWVEQKPVHASDTSQERVDETAKRKHEWVGLDGDIPGLGLVTEEFYNGMLCAEDILRKRNT